MFNKIFKFSTGVILFLAGVLLFSTESSAFNQPPMNLSATTFLDGGAPPGFYYLNYSIFVQGKKPVDIDGKTIPGEGHVNVLVQLNQFYWVTPIQVLGANLGLDAILPVVAPSARGTLGPVPLMVNTAGIGDPVVGVALHWDKGQLFGAPFLQRVESDLTLPYGKYDKGQVINPGNNHWTLDSYYSAVWIFHPKWETSWRFWYALHGENDDTPVGPIKAGQAFHVNYAVSMAVHPKWRVGAAGYFLQQMTEDKVNNVTQTDSKERVWALGPGFVYMGQGLTLMLSHPIEFGVRNRFSGSRTTLQMIHKF